MRRPITDLRPPTFVSRETGAAELDFSVDTWDAMVAAGRLPRPIKTGIAGTTPRWRWRDVERTLAGKPAAPAESDPEPFFRGMSNGPAKERGRGAS